MGLDLLSGLVREEADPAVADRWSPTLEKKVSSAAGAGAMLCAR